jgi:predicted kinase
MARTSGNKIMTNQEAINNIAKLVCEARNTNMLISWADKRDWAFRMANTPQDILYHKEGDVWTHTRLVCASLDGDPDWYYLDDNTKTKLRWASLLHDVGKPRTTKEINGRISSLNHAKVGEKMARKILSDLGMDFHSRETICSLVRQHTKPPHAWNEEIDIEKQIIDLSWLCDLKLLYYLVKADYQGRVCDNKKTILDNLKLWLMYAEDLLKDYKPYEFENAHSRFLWFRNELSHRLYAAFEDFTCKVTMLSGLPGSGKDTYAAKNIDDPIISLDSLRRNGEEDQAIGLAKEQAKQYLRKRTDFCFNATNLTRNTRAKWIDIFAQYGARIKIVYIEPSMPVIKQQNQNREHIVPSLAIDHMFDILEVPLPTECHEIKYIVE